jgi:hypothetical protein
LQSALGLATFEMLPYRLGNLIGKSHHERTFRTQRLHVFLALFASTKLKIVFLPDGGAQHADFGDTVQQLLALLIKAGFENFKIDGLNVKISKPDSVMVTNIPDVNNKQNWLFGGVIAGGDSIATDSAFMAKYPGIIVENAVLEI